METNRQLVTNIMRIDSRDLDILIDLKYKLCEELFRCKADNMVLSNIDLLTIVGDWADQKIADIITTMKIPQLKISSPRKRKN